MSQDKLLGSLFKENQVGEGRKKKNLSATEESEFVQKTFQNIHQVFGGGGREGGRQKYKCRIRGIPKAQGSRYSRFLS